MLLTRRQSLSLLVSSPLVGLGIAGCGSTSNTHSTNDMTLKVGQISTSIAFFPFYIADQEGFFKKEGLTIGPRPLLGSGAKVATAVESGSIDIGGGVITDAFDMAIVDSQARVIGSLVNGYYTDIIMSKNLQRETGITKASPLVDKVKALVGKKIGITGPGSGNEALVIYLFRQQGLNARKDAVLVNLGSNNLAVMGALRAGRVDALSFFSPVGQQAEAEGTGTIMISPIKGDMPGLMGCLYGAFYTRQSVIDAKPKAIQAFIRALALSEAYIHEQPTKALALLQKYLKLNQETTQAVFTAMRPIMATSPRINQQAYDIITKFHVQAGLITVALPYNSIIAANTINSALDGFSS